MREAGEESGEMTDLSDWSCAAAGSFAVGAEGEGGDIGEENPIGGRSSEGGERKGEEEDAGS